MTLTRLRVALGCRGGGDVNHNVALRSSNPFNNLNIVPHHSASLTLLILPHLPSLLFCADQTHRENSISGENLGRCHSYRRIVVGSVSLAASLRPSLSLCCRCAGACSHLVKMSAVFREDFVYVNFNIPLCCRSRECWRRT